MFKKIFSLGLSVLVLAGSLSGCSIVGPDLSEYANNNVAASTGSRLIAATQADLESNIYDYISNRVLVGDSLVEVSATDKSNIQELLGKINTQLTSASNQGPLSESMLNYLLLQFGQTPYEWYQGAYNAVGRDVATRFIFVDVTYNTSTNVKSVVADSKIVNGSPMEEVLKEQRYKDYVAMLQYQMLGNSKYNEAASTFGSRWGSIASIMSEQQGDSLATRTSKFSAGSGIGRLTYSGLVGTERLNKPATMVVRYVLKYNLNLGEETELMVDQLYLKSYTLNDKDAVVASFSSDLSGISTLEPFMRDTIMRYHRCVEESNDSGLYSIFTNYAKLDKYYLDLRNYSYSAFGGYTVRPLARADRYVTALITRVNQSRMKGVNMSMPTYEEELICNFYLADNDKIQIKDIIPISCKLVGEPRSIVKNISGISDQLTYDSAAMSSENKEAVLNTICAFEQLVVNKDYASDAFLSTVDLGISDFTLTTLVSNIRAFESEKLVAYVLSWDTQTNVYSVVNVRECFDVEGVPYTAEAKIGLAKRDNEWRVISYNRMFVTKGASLIDESKALCVLKPTVSFDKKDASKKEVVVKEEAKAQDESKVDVDSTAEQDAVQGTKQDAEQTNKQGADEVNQPTDNDQARPDSEVEKP